MPISIEKIKSDYIKKHPKSLELWKRAQKVLPGGCSRPALGKTWHVLDVPPLYVDKSQGCRIWDVDGNDYVDYWQHHALFLGHAHPAVVEAIKEYAERGAFAYDWNEIQIKLAEKVCKMVPCAEKFCSVASGTEGNMYATRLARVHTKRDKIIRFAGNFHGHSDLYSAEWPVEGKVRPPFSDRVQSVPGIPDAMTRDIVIVPDEIEAVENAIKKHNPAGIIFEAVHGSGGGGMATGSPDPLEFFKALREITEENGVLMIADEVITGFRLAPGGAQEYFDFVPDISVHGKNICGSLGGSGGFAGKDEIMKHNPLQSPPEESVSTGMTFAGAPMHMAAGYAALSVIDGAGGRLNIQANRLGDRLREGLNDVFERNEFPAQAVGTGSLCNVCFVKDPKDLPIVRPLDFQLKNDETAGRKWRLWLRTYAGIEALSGLSMMMGVPPHTSEDIDNLIAATEEYVKKEKA